jgi:hypothetical protein
MKLDHPRGCERTVNRSAALVTSHVIALLHDSILATGAAISARTWCLIGGTRRSECIARRMRTRE